MMGVPVEQSSSTYYKNEYGGRLPIGSMKHYKEEKRKYTLLYVTKFMFIGGALGLVLISFLRFTAVDTPTVHEAILNFYYLFFGIIMLLSQLNVDKVVD